MTVIALASPRVATSLSDGLARIDRLAAEAAARAAVVVAFPEAYLPGLRGQDFTPFPFTPADQATALAQVSATARRLGIAIILGMERLVPEGRQIGAWVIDRDGSLLGVQTKNQLDPSEDAYYVPGDTRQLFEVAGLRFGVAICHEGWRYPETVRWAAQRGAHVVFHPQLTGLQHSGRVPAHWGATDAPYYEKAMMMRAIENAIYFASVNYAVPFQESATSVVDPSGALVAHLPYGEEGVLVVPLDLARATGHLARRFAPARYRDERPRGASPSQ